VAKTSNPNYTLSGQITNRQRQPLPELTVRAYDQDPQSPDNFLGEAVTNEDGRYTIRFTEAQFKTSGKEIRSFRAGDDATSWRDLSPHQHHLIQGHGHE
jgi:5-hydroxyisourate hydrolase-like protein (transthyretin family)